MVTASMTPYYRQSERRLNNEGFFASKMLNVIWVQQHLRNHELQYDRIQGLHFKFTRKLKNILMQCHSICVPKWLQYWDYIFQKMMNQCFYILLRIVINCTRVCQAVMPTMLLMFGAYNVELSRHFLHLSLK